MWCRVRDLQFEGFGLGVSGFEVQGLWVRVKALGTRVLGYDDRLDNVDKERHSGWYGRRDFVARNIAVFSLKR